MAIEAVSDAADGRDRQKTLALMEIAEALKLIQVQLNDIRLEVKAIAATAGPGFREAVVHYVGVLGWDFICGSATLAAWRSWPHPPLAAAPPDRSAGRASRCNALRPL